MGFTNHVAAHAASDIPVASHFEGVVETCIDAVMNLMTVVYNIQSNQVPNLSGKASIS